MSVLRAVLFVAVASSALSAQGRGNAQGRGKSASRPAAASKVRVVYTDKDRDSDARVITGWYAVHPDQRGDSPGRGRARGHAIAPGWQKKLVRSSVVPVEYRTYLVPAPPALIQLLPPVRSNWGFMVAENRVLLIDRPTWTIVDVVVP